MFASKTAPSHPLNIRDTPNRYRNVLYSRCTRNDVEPAVNYFYATSPLSFAKQILICRLFNSPLAKHACFGNLWVFVTEWDILSLSNIHLGNIIFLSDHCKNIFKDLVLHWSMGLWGGGGKCDGHTIPCISVTVSGIPTASLLVLRLFVSCI